MYGDACCEHAAELAEHYAQAESTVGTSKVVRFCLTAGEVAFRTCAFEEAIVQFERASLPVVSSCEMTVTGPVRNRNYGLL